MPSNTLQERFAVDESIFIEQAEYIPELEMERWVQSHPSEKVFLKKLASAGAKLIVGPRGCGKTTLLLKSYTTLRNTSTTVFPVYVNFKTSLKLEPLYKSNVNAGYWFSLWLILKVYKGIYETLSAKPSTSTISLSIHKNALNKIIADLEAGKITALEKLPQIITVESLQDELNVLLEKLDFTRVVLLLDDAAHAFSFAQQRGFFDFFRAIKTRNISPKAAIYPGVTSFSATFQAGHDAEEIDVWLKPDDPEYLPFMRNLVRRRLPREIFLQIESNQAAFELICYSAYGVPRALLNMLHQMLAEDEDQDYTFNTRLAQKVIKGALATTLDVYTSLKLKLPIYANFIKTGEGLLQAAANSIKEYNKEKPLDKKSVTIAINDPLSVEMLKTLGFLEYAGLVVPKGTSSRGQIGSFKLFGIHYAYLLSHNSILPTRSPSTAELVTALKKRSAHEYTRVVETRLIGQNPQDAFALMLPPCQVCQTPRNSDDAKFCHACGAALKNISIFDQLVSHDINKLSLTERRVASIKANSSIRQVKDILLDHDHKQLLSVPQIGPIWAKRIMSYAEEYIA